MGYPSIVEIIDSARKLTYREPDSEAELIRTNGFWHVLIFLRYLRLNGRRNEAVLYAFDLAEACFDLNGIDLPINRQSRNVYYEPGAAQGSAASALFRHREGPRQTYLNRIYTGLAGQGPRQPRLFNVSGTTLPVTVSLVGDWVNVLRSNPNHRLLLDERFTSLITWIFRFGVPCVGINAETASIARHMDNGRMEARDGLRFDPLPASSPALRLLLQNYLGLDDDTLQNLLPEQIQQTQLLFAPQANAFNVWSAEQVVSFDTLSSRMREEFLLTSNVEPGISPETNDQSEYNAILSNPPYQAAISSYTVDWDNLTIGLLQAPPLLGVENSVARCLAALRAGKFVILLGPPGTGKTELAKQLCMLAMRYGVPGYITATATAEWSTFETIGGYLPDTQDTGQLKFTRNFFTEALGSGKWLVIDELNRADIDKAFGELFTLFAGEKVQLAFRQDDKPVVLVPPDIEIDESVESPIYQQPDWRMLGTMNTFDKASLFQLSYAFMRRFAFIEIPVPSQADYRVILTNAIEAVKQPEDEGFWEECFQYLEAVFASSPDEGLTGIGLNVGPAIAIDITKFLLERYLIEKKQNQQPESRKLILEGLEMYLYSQFEGKDREHPRIANAIGRALQLSDKEESLTSRYLTVWTGYEA